MARRREPPKPVLKGLQLWHFKSFQDSKLLPLSKLTLIFGRNNSGKSTLLQSLLLLRQTIESAEYGPRLNPRGPLYAAGTFRDLVHNHSGDNFRWVFDLDMSELVNPRFSNANLEVEFVRDDHLARIARLRVTLDDMPTVEIKRGPGMGGPYELHIDGARLGNESRANFWFSPSRFFPLIGSEPKRVGAPNKRRILARQDTGLLLDSFEDFIVRLRAVGAFRHQPERRYEYLGRVPDALAGTGQRAIDALIKDSVRNRSKDKGRLLAEVNTWLNRIGHARIMPIKPIAPRLFEVLLRDTDAKRWANYADVGFGIGQALPVLVEGLLTPIGGLFIVQEPEIHLHPDAQLAMADFLIELAKSGRQVIVETHSENILLRVRRRIAEAKPRGLTSADVSFLVVEKQRER